MLVVIIDYNVSEDKIFFIKALLEREKTHNINFSGETFEVKKGKFTEILNHDDKYSHYVKLLNQINDIIKE